MTTIKERLAVLFRLFWGLFRISLFVVGGGYAIAVVADDFFAKRGWTEEGEIVGRLPVFQMVPGIIATHVAVYVGSKVAGRLGAAVGVAAVALPSVVIFTAVSMGYASLPVDNPWLASAFIGLRAALAGIVAATILRGWRRSLDSAFAYAVMAGAVAAIAAFGVAVPWVLLAAMALGLIVPESARPDGEATRRFRSSLLPLLLFLKYGALCFGGGFVLVPMYMQDFVGPSAAFLQISPEEFANLMSLTQMTPGPIGVNGATFFGYRLAGVPGAALASAALLLPGSIILYVVLRSLERFSGSRIVRGILRGARPASVALMLCALWAFASMCWWQVGSDGTTAFNPTTIAISAAVAVAMAKWRPNVMVLIFLSAIVAAALR